MTIAAAGTLELPDGEGGGCVAEPAGAQQRTPAGKASQPVTVELDGECTSGAGHLSADTHAPARELDVHDGPDGSVTAAEVATAVVTAATVVAVVVVVAAFGLGAQQRTAAGNDWQPVTVADEGR